MLNVANIHSLLSATTEFAGSPPCRQELANEARSDRMLALAERCAR